MAEKKTWTVLEWAARSPNPTPSEHLWKELKFAENWSGV